LFYAATWQISLGGMGGGFLEPPIIFLSLAPFLSFSKKERNGERKKNRPYKFGGTDLTVPYSISRSTAAASSGLTPKARQ